MAYSCLNFQRAPEGLSNESYIWDLGEKQRGLVATGKDEGVRQRPVKTRGEEGRSSGTLVGLVSHWDAQGPRRKPLSHPFAVRVQVQQAEPDQKQELPSFPDPRAFKTRLHGDPTLGP